MLGEYQQLRGISARASALPVGAAMLRRDLSTNGFDWLVCSNSDASGTGVVLIGWWNDHVVRTTPVR
jgi:hypothetical protein